MILKVSAGCWINTDLIARVEDRQVEPQPENSIAVYLPADGSFSLYDAEADNLRMWLDQQALDLSAPAFQDDDYQLFLRKGGTWSYSDWCAARDRLTDYIERPDSWWQVTENAAKVRELEVELKHFGTITSKRPSARHGDEFFVRWDTRESGWYTAEQLLNI